MVWSSYFIVAVMVLTFPCQVRAAEGRVITKSDSAVDWFLESRTGETLYSWAVRSSKTHDNVAIAIYVSKVGSQKAIDHGKKMAHALSKVGISSQIIVQTHDGAGVGFSFYVKGFGVYDDSLGDKGVYSPRNAIRILPKVVAHQRAQAP